MKALIVGGGIGGLATAVAFHQRGWEVEVLERSPEFTEIGAGLSIQPNGRRALDTLGLGDLVHGTPAEPLTGIRRVDGAWLVHNDTDALRNRFGPWATLHRAALVDALRGLIPHAVLRPGTTVHEVLADGTVRHDGGTASADLVVGADGVHSVTRRSAWPQAPGPRYLGYTTWRLLTPLPVTASAEIWGRGERFGYAPMPDGRTYCYSMANAPAGSHAGLDELRTRFSHWCAPVPDLLNGATAGDVLQHDTYELPPLRSYVVGKVALVGDAAHAMAPNPGTGRMPSARGRGEPRRYGGPARRGGGRDRIRSRAQTAHPDSSPALAAGGRSRALEFADAQHVTRRHSSLAAGRTVRSLDHPHLYLDVVNTDRCESLCAPPARTPQVMGRHTDR